MNLKKSHLIVAALIILTAILYWKYSRPEVAVSQTEADSNEEVVEQEAMSANSAAENPESEAQNNPQNSVAGAGENKVDEAAVQAQFIEALKGLGSCLDIKNSADPDQSDPKVDNLINSVRNEIGDPVIRSEDWSTTHLVLPNGEQRRIRIEMEYDANDRIVKRLKYYSLDKENLPVPIQLSNESSLDPQDSYIASLEKDGQVSLREKGERIYFQNGEELIFTQKNERLSDIEINRSGRTFKCMGLETGKSSCNCM